MSTWSAVWSDQNKTSLLWCAQDASASNCHVRHDLCRLSDQVQSKASTATNLKEKARILFCSYELGTAMTHYLSFLKIRMDQMDQYPHYLAMDNPLSNTRTTIDESILPRGFRHSLSDLLQAYDRHSTDRGAERILNNESRIWRLSIGKVVVQKCTNKPYIANWNSKFWFLFEEATVNWRSPEALSTL